MEMKPRARKNKTERFELRIDPDTKMLLQDAAAVLGMSLANFLVFAASEKVGEILGEGLSRYAEKRP